MRGDDVAGDHDPVGPSVLTEGAVDEGETFVGISCVPGDEEFHGVAVADHAACGDDNFAHIIDMMHGD